MTEIIDELEKNDEESNEINYKTKYNDGFINHILIPVHLRYNPFFSAEEKFIVAHLIYLSNKFSKNGCTLTNEDLALANRVSTRTIRTVISKINKLGWMSKRTDNKVHIKNSIPKNLKGQSLLIYKLKQRKEAEKIYGANFYYQKRQFKVLVTEEWFAYETILNYAFFKHTSNKQMNALMMVDLFDQTMMDKKIIQNNDWRHNILKTLIKLNKKFQVIDQISLENIKITI